MKNKKNSRTVFSDDLTIKVCLFIDITARLDYDVSKVKLAKSGWKHDQQKRREKEKSSVRVKLKHVFGIVKKQFRYRKTRYRGLAKTAASLYMLFALANLILLSRRGLAG